MKFDRALLPLLAPAIYLLVLPLAHVTALRSFAFVISIVLLLWSLRTADMRAIPLKAPFAVWLGAALLSMVWAVHPDFSIDAIRSEIVQGFVSFLIFFKFTRTSRDLKFFMGTLFASGVVTSVIALVHFLRGLDPIPVGAFYGGALSNAGFVTTVLPFLAATTLLRSDRYRIAMVCAILLLLLAAYGTTNRGIWLYLLVELAFFGCLYLVRVDLQPKARKTAIALLTVLAILGTGTLFFASKGRLGLEGGPTEIVAGTAKADPRPQLWKDSIDWIQRRPFTGAGFGMMVLGKELQEQQKDLTHTHAHNIILNYALQLGLFGPLVLAFVFYSAGREFWKLTKCADKELIMLGIAGIAMISGILAAGMIEDLFNRHLAWLFWSLVGMTLGYAMSSKARLAIPARLPD